MDNRPFPDAEAQRETTDATLPDAVRPRAALPLGLTVFLLAFLGWHVYKALVPSTSPARTSSAKKAANADAVDPTQGLLLGDLLAKAAFLTSSPSQSSTQPNSKFLTRALEFAESLQVGSDNAPGAARRVILLRALLDHSAPLAPKKNGPDPRAAFGSDLPPETPKADRERYASEGRLWETIFAGGRLSPKQTDAAAAQIRAIPSLRWWTSPALIALYKNQGDLSEASRYAAQARERALPTLLPAGVLLVLKVALPLVGGLLLLYSLARGLQKRAAAPGENVLPSIWPVVPASIAPEKRRLGAGELMGVFVLYLLTMEVLRVAIGGFDGFGPHHFLRFGGLVGPFQEQLKALPFARRAAFSVLLSSATYVLSAVPATLTLCALAKRRGASLADEIGWHRRRFGPNLVFGLGAYAAGSALMIPVILLASRVLFRHAPAPDNPVIGLLINATGLLLPLLLIFLTAVAAPLVEELMFRGVFYQAVRQRVGVWPGIVLTGLTFGFIHPVGIAEMFALATLGGVFAWMAETRQSLVPSIFAHFLNNFLSTAILLLVLAG